MPDYTPNEWANLLLRRLRIKPSTANTQALVGWAKAEGGNWANDAKYNPLNTTQSMPGAGNTGTQGNIKSYTDWNQGLDATVKTLNAEGGRRYGSILSALRGNDPVAVGRAIEASPWGTGGLALKTIPHSPGHPLADVAGAVQTASSPTIGTVPQASPTGDNRVSKLVDVIAQLNKSQEAFSVPKTPAPVMGQTLSDTNQAMAEQLKQQQAESMKMIQALNSAPSDTSTDTYSANKTAELQSGGDGSQVSGTGADAALSWAKGHLGFKETGTNAGGIAGYLNKQFGMSAAPWCAMFTSAAVTKGGAPAAARTASVAAVRAKAAAGQGYAKGVFSGSRAQRGDLIMWGDNHIAMVEGVDDKGIIHYIGGNQSNGVTEGKTSGAAVDAVRPLYGRR